jgi:hypothetical protein
MCSSTKQIFIGILFRELLLCAFLREKCKMTEVEIQLLKLYLLAKDAEGKNVVSDNVHQMLHCILC